jgi:hypothetical protein
MKLFCKTKHFDKNAKLWLPGEILEAADGADVPDHFSKTLPSRAKVADESPKALSQVQDGSSMDFIQAMAQVKAHNESLRASSKPAPVEVQEEPELVESVSQTKHLKRGK